MIENTIKYRREGEDIMPENNTLFEQKYKYYVQEKIKHNIEQRWWGSKILLRKVNKWIEQFPENSIVPYLLLDSLILITDEQIYASIKYLFSQIKNMIYANNINLSDEQLEQEWKRHLLHSVFIAAHKPGDSASSAPIIIRHIRDYLKNNFEEVSAENLCDCIETKEINNVYLVNDFIGTGKQMKEYLTYKFKCVNSECRGIKSNECSLNDIAENTSLQFNILTILCCSDGYNQITQQFPYLNLYTTNIITNEYNLLSEKCNILVDHNYLVDVIATIKKIKNEKYILENEYALNLLIGFEHGFPNNALELFWWDRDNENWSPLYSRIG